MRMHDDIFCYASETHIIPQLYNLFRKFPCHPAQVDTVGAYLQRHLTQTMIEMVRYNVERGARPGILIFDEDAVEDAVSGIRSFLHEGQCGSRLYSSALELIRELLDSRDPRPIKGEKTPGNIFAMANYPEEHRVVPIAVIREPIGTVRSMQQRNDPYAGAFAGGTERNIGMYMEYAEAVHRCMQNTRSQLVSFEEIAQDPVRVLTRLHRIFDREPDEHVMRFVEGAPDKEIPVRYNINYRRQKLSANAGDLTPVDLWKIGNLTKGIREAFNYSDEMLSALGYNIPTEWPGEELTAAFLPLSGFYPAEANGNIWMRREGRLIAYLPPKYSNGCSVDLNLWSRFPGEIAGDGITLDVFVNGKPKHQFLIQSGPRRSLLSVRLERYDLKPVGNAGSYAFVELRSSIAYAPAVIIPNAKDIREISFVLSDWSLRD